MSVFAVLPLAPAEPNLATCAPREPPATWRCRYGFPAPSAPQGCFLNEAAFISGGLLTTDEGPGLAVVHASAAATAVTATAAATPAAIFAAIADAAERRGV